MNVYGGLKGLGRFCLYFPPPVLFKVISIILTNKSIDWGDLTDYS